MALSDCLKCWDTPCSCGYSYTHLTDEALAKHIARICQYRSREQALNILNKAKEEVILIEKWNKEN